MKTKSRICEVCGKIFVPKAKNQYGIQKFCSKKCNNKNYNRNRKKRIEETNIKRCTKCGIEKDISEFYESSPSWCKECFKKHIQEKRKNVNKPPENVNKPPENVNKPPEKKSAAPKNVKKSTKKINELIIEEGFNGLSGNLKAIDLYKKLSEKIFILMRINRISKYNGDTQNIILELMNACSTHLQKELQSTKKSNSEMEKPFKIKKEVINIDWEEIQE